MMTIQTQCADRKVMVRGISEHLGLPAVYLRMPSRAYKIGEVTVNQDASVSGEREDLQAVVEFLLEHGYIAERPADFKAAGRTILQIQAQDWTVQGKVNFLHMVYARQDLINRMLKMDCLHIENGFISNLADDDFEAVLRQGVQDGQVRGVNIKDDVVSIELPFEEEAERWVCASKLISACVKVSKSATRVFPRRCGADKYHANAWLNRLGFGGADNKELRRALMGHLDGYAAFKTAEKMQEHRDKMAQRRAKHD